MDNLLLARKNREVDPESWERFYANEVVRRIRAKYSADQELAILRQKDRKPDEFHEYDTFVEQCKADVKRDLEG